MATPRTYAVITSRAFCKEYGPITIEYFSDGKRFDDWERCRDHGIRSTGSDDFNIGVIEGGKLVDLRWMEDSINEDAETLGYIERCIFL
jgi:hypothetical protein